jgi:hypothetical protein
LKKYGGLDYIDKCWWALHIDNPYWALRDIYKVCRNNGGYKVFLDLTGFKNLLGLSPLVCFDCVCCEELPFSTLNHWR